ncbi:MAG TPA: hydrogenase maturation nickel metallochaperone HypA [Polyangia bacterium]
MHELSLAQSMVEILTPIAREHGARRVVRVRLRLGELTHADPETLTFAFEVAAKDTLLEGCALDIERVPLRGRCPACGWEGDLALGDLTCQRCGAAGFKVTGGRELQLASVDIED